mgnify:CR=1 FL=1
MPDVNQDDMHSRLRHELSEIVKFIDSTRKGMSALETTVRIGSEKFPEASSQLTSVTGDLENAANNIMTILEGIMTDQEKADALLKRLAVWASSLEDGRRAEGAAIAAGLEAIQAKTKSDIMEIFSGMSFQDLTGQKLKKIISSLAVVESRILGLAIDFGLNDRINPQDRTEILSKLKASEHVPIKQDVVDSIMKGLSA